MRSILIRLPFLFLLTLATPALASDGVLEINQTCAVQTGCFAGDTPGFPVTITEPGTSYVLTSRLIVPDENTDGIVISTSDVGIDLNNFAIIRSGCEGVTTDCTPGIGNGSGVERTSSSNSGLSVKNGSITGMGSYGVLLGIQAEVTNLRVRWNRLVGIIASNGSTVSGNTAYENGDDGISTSPGSTVSGNTAYQNGNKGIDARAGSTVSENTVYQNGGDGISANTGSTVSGNTVYNNGTDGIRSTGGSTVSGNTAYSNGGDGIRTGSGANVQRNTVRFNEGYGLNLGLGSAYRENVTTNNQTGTVNGGVDAGANVINGVVSPTP